MTDKLFGEWEWESETDKLITESESDSNVMAVRTDDTVRSLSVEFYTDTVYQNISRTMFDNGYIPDEIRTTDDGRLKVYYEKTSNMPVGDSQ